MLSTCGRHLLPECNCLRNFDLIGEKKKNKLFFFFLPICVELHQIFSIKRRNRRQLDKTCLPRSSSAHSITVSCFFGRNLLCMFCLSLSSSSLLAVSLVSVVSISFSLSFFFFYCTFVPCYYKCDGSGTQEARSNRT